MNGIHITLLFATIAFWTRPLWREATHETEHKIKHALAHLNIHDDCETCVNEISAEIMTPLDVLEKK